METEVKIDDEQLVEKVVAIMKQRSGPMTLVTLDWRILGQICTEIPKDKLGGKVDHFTFANSDLDYLN